MRLAEIVNIKNETNKIKTIEFKLNFDIRPGQFLMVWIPGADEIPLAVTKVGKESAVTVEKVGPATGALHEMEKGEMLGISGPYGNGFDLSADEHLIIAGGTGMAALARAAEEMSRSGKVPRIAMGARTSDDLFFVERMMQCGEVHLATDDGTAGHHGFVTEIAERLMAENEPDMILACGPEPMMVPAVELARNNNIPIQCSLERYMKCGIGICGSCQCGKYTVCRDGPVFTGEQLEQMEDFGKFKRDASGRKVMF